ncbi:putative cyclase-associated protein CAP/septum formation inhibitor MinC [Helianthus annuus]|uniref:Cyclase-associated protein CAP/septum formation inhibitor MinC n=1 Tax=Helianthus annuus TaxID=4232 RepID=A0A9K3EFE4_HELAN|nr:putative cyclase-associated protein CAP/septum formation inhibitor MinC [Helianthus annuus]KAJ0480155.1 putative cyclase-associated protein CAP/septum formation inhibitor MinC [Helianthus annuus]KAJ0496896.1 putative cyclase-associated protein CAP/septum formation inhibitor MinC [Helianthus annuus]KAJ0662927.1 putative cyclase-associated protein CAP/septum formation inhibitor MinC [Helianthus annuus]KAJ0848301.1 putative cyclase-associated protein CAP/septum formation inhibitor MinC [Heliant
MIYWYTCTNLEDNTTSVQLYLSKDSLEASITTSKASEVNVMVPPKDPNADMAEHPMPHQYIHPLTRMATLLQPLYPTLERNWVFCRFGYGE